MINFRAHRNWSQEKRNETLSNIKRFHESTVATFTWDIFFASNLCRCISCANKIFSFTDTVSGEYMTKINATKSKLWKLIYIHKTCFTFHLSLSPPFAHFYDNFIFFETIRNSNNLHIAIGLSWEIVHFVVVNYYFDFVDVNAHCSINFCN